MEDMTDAVVPEGMVAGGPGLGAESAGPVAVVGSEEGSSGPMGLEGRPRKDEVDGDRGPGLGAESAGPVVVVGSGEGSSDPMGLEGRPRKDEVDGDRGPGLGAESAGPVVVVGSGEESSGPMGLEGAVKKRKGRPRKYEFDGDRVGLSSSMPESLPKRGPGRPRGPGRRQFLASMGEFLALRAIFKKNKS